VTRDTCLHNDLRHVTVHQMQDNRAQGQQNPPPVAPDVEQPGARNGHVHNGDLDINAAQPFPGAPQYFFEVDGWGGRRAEKLLT
jgi:hypothetical protein